MKLITAFELTHELADHARLDDGLAGVITSDLSEQAADQRNCVDMFEDFITGYYKDTVSLFGDRVDRLEAMPLHDIPEISLEQIRSVDQGAMGVMMSTVLELSCQAVTSVEDTLDPAVRDRASVAINMVGQFWVEAGAEISNRITPGSSQVEPEP